MVSPQVVFTYLPHLPHHAFIDNICHDHSPHSSDIYNLSICENIQGDKRVVLSKVPVSSATINVYKLST